MTDNIYQKLAALRIGAQGALGKEGKNKFQDFSYFRLEDILQYVVPKMATLGLWEHTSFAWDTDAQVYVTQTTFVNLDKPDEQLTFRFDIHHNTIKGQVSQQASGTSNTYARRYIWQMVLALVEANSDPDEINDGKQVKVGPLVDKETLAKISALGVEVLGENSSKWGKTAMWASKGRVNEVENLTQEEAERLVTAWEQKLANSA